MPTAITTDEWVQLPNGIFVSTRRLQKYTTDFSHLDDYGCLCMEPSDFTLQDASRMNTYPDSLIPFNGWEKYGIPIDSDEPPIDKLIKSCILLRKSAEEAREKGGFSEESYSNEKTYVPTHLEYIGMLLDTFLAKSRGEEPLASHYPNVFGLNVVREVIEFNGRIRQGPNRGKYNATLFRYDENGILEPVADIVIAGQGRIRVIDEYGYPFETSKEWGPVENLGRPELEGVEIEGSQYDTEGIHLQGHLYLDEFRHSAPERGEQRFVFHSPTTGGSGYLCTYITKQRSDGSDSISALPFKDLSID